MTTDTERRIRRAEIAMRIDQFETGIARASTCHSYFIRDGITPALLAALAHILALWRTP